MVEVRGSIPLAPIVFAREGGSEAFRKVKFSLWIGYDW